MVQSGEHSYLADMLVHFRVLRRRNGGLTFGNSPIEGGVPQIGRGSAIFKGVGAAFRVSNQRQDDAPSLHEG